ncbi:PIN domain-containing protein [Methylobacterium oryzae CBMB20]
MNSTIEPIFIDTNVLVYARDNRNADKRGRARAWLAVITHVGCARTDLQVLNELTRWILKNEPGRSLRDVRAEVETIGAWGTRLIDQDDAELAWLVRENLGYQWFDCLLVAAAQLAGCRSFLTEDMAHGAVFDGLTLINPFRTSPDDVLRRT